MPEMLCVVDENDNFVKAEDRKIVHSSRVWHRGVHIFMYNPAGELLLQLRAPDKDKYPNRWDVVSEHVTVGESYEQAAARALDEELGITGLPLEPLLHFRMVYGPQDHMVCKLFRSSCGGPLKPNEEVAGLRWYSERELREILDKTPETLTPWATEHLKWRFGMQHRLIIFK